MLTTFKNSNTATADEQETLPEEWEPDFGPGFLTFMIDRKQVTADVTRIHFEVDFSPVTMMSFAPGKGGFGAIFQGWVENEKEYSKRWPVLKKGDARLAEINSTSVKPKMTFDTVMKVLQISVKPIRLMFLTNIRPHVDALDHIAGQTGYGLEHYFKEFLQDMDAIMVQEDELRKWFISREKHFREKQEKERLARKIQEAQNAENGNATSDDPDSEAQTPTPGKNKSKSKSKLVAQLRSNNAPVGCPEDFTCDLTGSLLACASMCLKQTAIPESSPDTTVLLAQNRKFAPRPCQITLRKRF